MTEKLVKLRLFSLSSICLNVVLAVCLVAVIKARNAAPSGESASMRLTKPVAAAASPSGRIRVRSEPAAALPQAQFDWRQVESEDYKQYIANLRGVGCPEKTIREIILADVNDLFASKAATLTRTNQYLYWRKDPVSRSPEQLKEQQELYLEKRDLLKTLGMEAPDFTDLLGESFRDKREEEQLQLAFLTEAKRQQVTEVWFEQAQQELAAGNDVAQSEAIERQAQARIQAMLTPDEFKDYELRCSTDAAQLRGVLEVAGLTEQEFRVIFDAWRSLKGLSPGTAEYQAAQQSSEATIQQLLGPDRFQSYLSGVKQLGYSR
jgi:hypothetical protein